MPPSSLTDRLLAPRHSIGLSVVLHLAPGAIIALAYVAIGVPFAERLAVPTVVGLALIALTVLLPWELGLPLALGRARHGRLTLEGVVRYRERVPRRQMLWLVPVLISIAVVVAGTLGFLDTVIRQAVFGWVPASLQLTDLPSARWSLSAYTMATALNIAFSGVAVPLVEELYFRGFLLPRLERFGWWSVPINSGLFALYHLWTPWMAVTRFLFLLPMVHAVRQFRSVRIGIWVHCLLNTVGILIGYAAVISGR